MAVIALTVLVGLALVLFFVVFFLVESSTNSSRERDSLLPLAEEMPHAGKRTSRIV